MNLTPAKNFPFTLKVNQQTGGLSAFTLRQFEIKLASTSFVDVKVDGRWLVEGLGDGPQGFKPVLDAPQALEMTQHVGDDFILHVQVTPNGDHWLCRADIQAGSGLKRRVKLEAFRFQLGPFTLGLPEDCVLDIPGLFPTYGLGRPFSLPPGTPLAQTVGIDAITGTAPDWGPGIIAISNQREQLCLAGWMDTKGEVSRVTIGS